MFPVLDICRQLGYHDFEADRWTRIPPRLLIAYVMYLLTARSELRTAEAFTDAYLQNHRGLQHTYKVDSGELKTLLSNEYLTWPRDRNR